MQAIMDDRRLINAYIAKVISIPNFAITTAKMFGIAPDKKYKPNDLRPRQSSRFIFGIILQSATMKSTDETIKKTPSILREARCIFCFAYGCIR